MDDLNRYIEKRKKKSVEFAEVFDAGYEEFKIGAMLRQAREQAGIIDYPAAQDGAMKTGIIPFQT